VHASGSQDARVVIRIAEDKAAHPSRVVYHAGSRIGIAVDVRTIPESGCVAAAQRNAAQDQEQTQGPTRCVTPFPCNLDRLGSTEPARRITDATARLHCRTEHCGLAACGEAQQPDKARHIGVLMGFSEQDSEARRWVAAFEGN